MSRFKVSCYCRVHRCCHTLLLLLIGTLNHNSVTRLQDNLRERHPTWISQENRFCCRIIIDFLWHSNNFAIFHYTTIQNEQPSNRATDTHLSRIIHSHSSPTISHTPGSSSRIP